MAKFIAVIFILLSFSSQSALAIDCKAWSLWDQFKHDFVSADGRIIDHQNSSKISTSEGQAYALFFALIAQDKVAFKSIMQWTNNNLANGKLAQQLPAWKWGENSQGEWQVLDYNSASDADVWISYSLQEAGRLWNNRYYTNLGRQLAHLILQKETVHLPRLGLTLLPAPYGFHPTKTKWRLNPSYLSIPLFKYLALNDERWNSVVNSSYQIISRSLINGFAPDWTQYQLHQGIKTDEKTLGIGSYDAIRVYLWAGMLHTDDKRQKSLLKRLSPMRFYVEKNTFPPTFVNDAEKGIHGIGSIGFSAALLPFLAASNSSKGLINQLSRLLDDNEDNQQHYYTQVLRLFGLGWYQKKFRLDADGRLLLTSHTSCKE